MKKIQILLILILCGLSQVYSQKGITPAVPSSNAISLGVYGETPVSHFTGIPDISLPLFNLEGTEVSVPLVLSYHAAGVRPEVHPGWTGLNWSLQAGGVITRTIKKQADEYNGDRMQSYYELAKNGFWGKHPGWKTYPVDGGNIPTSEIPNFHQYVLPNFDLEPDEFNFNFLGMSGKFYLTDNANFISSDGNKFKIIFQNDFIQPFIKNSNYGYRTANSFSDTFLKFTIIDQQGNQYIFGGTEDAIEYSEDMNPVVKGKNFLATSWYLTQIISANQADIIDFKYERGPFTAQLSKHGNFSIIGENSEYRNWKTSGNFISPVYLKEINDNKGCKIEFQISKSEDLSNSKASYKSIFDYSSSTDFELLDEYQKIPYFNNNPPKDRLDRIIWLKLDRIMINHSTAYPRAFTFEYNNNQVSRLCLKSVFDEYKKTSFHYKDLDLLPPYLSTITDHWGFNNNKGFSAFNNGIFSDREPNSISTKYGILDTIYYPTGGKTAFEYEMNDYAKVVNNKNRELVENKTGIAGGLRIKKITSFPIQGPSISKEYFYKKDYLIDNNPVSSGVLENYPKYYWEQVKDKSYFGMEFYHTVIESNPILPLTSNSSGCHVGYSEVIEVIKGGSSNDNYIIYKYTNHDNGYCDKNPEFLYNRVNAVYNPSSARGFERGKLLEKITYDKNKKKVAKDKFTWQRFDTEINSCKSIKYEILQNIEPLGREYFPSSVAYLNYTYPFLLTNEESILYYNNESDSINISKSYSYNEIYQLNTESISNSDLSLSLSSYKYPFDLKSNPIFQKMVDKHIMNPIVEKTESKNNVIVWKESKDFSLQHEKFYAPINSKIQKGNGVIEIREVYQYNNKGKIREIIGDDGVKTVYLWGYNNLYPIAEIKNATYSDVLSAIGGNEGTINDLESTLRPNMELVDSLRHSLPKALVTTYTFIPLLGMTSMTDPKGVKMSFEYDHIGRLKTIKDNTQKVLESYEYNYQNQ